MRERYIVLDIDSTLVCSYESLKLLSKINDIRDKTNELFLNDRVHEFNYIENPLNIPMWTLLRPYTREFITFCLSYFTGVIIWSAGKRNYVHSIKNILFPEEIRQPFLVFTYDETNVNIKRSIINKPLTKVFDKLKNANFSNTLVVDDRYDTFSLNHHNGILIPKYEPTDILQMHKDDDICLLQLMGWLSTEEVMNSVDYRTLDKSKIFSVSIDEYLNKVRLYKRKL
jgi:hypothetical protein